MKYKYKNKFSKFVDDMSLVNFSMLLLTLGNIHCATSNLSWT